MTTYRSLFRTDGYRPLILSVLTARVANAMSQVAVVIYLLDRTGSSVVAGAGAAAQLVPAVVSGPLAGALLDRVPRRRPLIVAVQTLRAVLLLSVVLVGQLANPPAAVYIALLAGLGLTFPVLAPGFRALVPQIVPRRLWDQANALDSITFDLAFVLGPALAAVTATTVGPAAALVVQAGISLLAALTCLFVREPAGRPRSEERVGQAVRTGLHAVLSHPELRATMAVMIVSGCGFGFFTIGLPLWAHGQLGLEAGAAGWMWVALGLGSILGGLAYGLRRPRGSDAQHAILFAGCAALPLLVVPFAGTLTAGMVAMAVCGLLTAPWVIAMFAIRQRSLPPELLGRAFAITISVNAAAAPTGALVAGLLVGATGVHRLLFVAGLAQVTAAVVAALMLRRAAPPRTLRPA